MRILFIFSGFVALGMIFWSALGFLMGLPSFPKILPLSLVAVLLFLGTGFLKNALERRKFKDFLESKKRDPDIQAKLKKESIEPGDKTGRANVKAEYKDRNTGVNWTGASVHGAVPHRKKRRTFLSRNS